MIYFSIVFDFYTPPVLPPRTFKKKVKEFFKLILKFAEKRRKAFTLNLCASSTLRVAKSGFSSLLQEIKLLSNKNKIELTGSAAYHALLPKIPSSEIVHQIRKNLEINRKFFDEFSPLGFVPPELGFAKKVKNVIESMGYDWVLLDESGFSKKNKGEIQLPQKIFLFKDSNLKAFFVNSFFSHCLAKKKERSIEELKKEIRQKILKKDKKTLSSVFRHFIQNRKNYYLIIFLNYSFFQNFNQERLEFLQALFSMENIGQEKIRLVTVSQLPKFFSQSTRIRPKSSAKRYLREKTPNPFLIWDNSRNKIQKLQWRLLRLALNTFSNPAVEEADQLKNQARNFLDEGLFSDQFLWSSRRPYWNIKIVEKGARLLQNVVVLMGKDKEKREGKGLYQEIMTMGRKLYGEKVIKE